MEENPQSWKSTPRIPRKAAKRLRQPAGILLSNLLLKPEDHIEKDEHEDLLEPNTTHVDMKSFRTDQQDKHGRVRGQSITLTK